MLFVIGLDIQRWILREVSLNRSDFELRRNNGLVTLSEQLASQ